MSLANNYFLPNKSVNWEDHTFMPQNDGEIAPLVVLVGKDEETRFLLKTFLDVWKCRAGEATNETDLIKIAGGEKPNLILMDVSLAFEEDLTCLRRMRALNAFKNTPIIVVSGHARACNSALALAAGADEYMIKPIDFDRLENPVKRYPFNNRRAATEMNFGGLA
ncbi:MAG: response regulator [Pyrinomonadaceae bacterium]